MKARIWLLATASLALGGGLLAHRAAEKEHARILHVLGKMEARTWEIQWTTEKVLLATIRSKITLIKWLLKDQKNYWFLIKSDDFLPDSNKIGSALTEAETLLWEENPTAEDLTQVVQKLTEIHTQLWEKLRDQETEILEKVHAGSDHITDEELRDTQRYISECLTLIDREIAKSGVRPNYLTVDTSELMELMKEYAWAPAWTDAKDKLREIINFYIEKNTEWTSTLTLHHLAEIGTRLNAGDSPMDLIKAYTPLAIVGAILLLFFIGVATIYAKVAAHYAAARKVLDAWQQVKRVYESREFKSWMRFLIAQFKKRMWKLCWAIWKWSTWDRNGWTEIPNERRLWEWRPWDEDEWVREIHVEVVDDDN